MRKTLTLLVAMAVALLPAAFSSQAKASSKYTVTFKVSKTSITKGQKITLSGKVSPKAAGKTIKFQALLGSEGDETWTTVRTATIRSDGSYSRKVTPFAGAFRWRAYKPSGSGHGAGVSKAVTIKTYSWYKMANADDTELAIPRGDQWLGRYGAIPVAGVTVSRYFATNQLAGDTTRWYTQHTCKRIRAEVGLWDAASASAVGQFRIFANSTKVASVQVKKGTMIAVDASFSPSKTGAVTFTGEAKGSGVTPIVASNPRILCTGFNSDLFQ